MPHGGWRRLLQWTLFAHASVGSIGLWDMPPASPPQMPPHVRRLRNTACPVCTYPEALHISCCTAHTDESGNGPAAIGLVCSLFWSVMWGSLYKFALPKLVDVILGASYCDAILNRLRIMLTEVGFMRGISGLPIRGHGALSDTHAAGMMAWFSLHALVHLMAGILSLSAALHGWDAVGSTGHLAFFTATWMLLGWSLFVLVDDTLRCFLPKVTSISGMRCRCPPSFWVITCLTYHPFWVTLILPMDRVSAGYSAYHTLFAATVFGGGLQYACRMLAVVLDALGRGMELLHHCVVIVNVVVVLLCRGMLYFPSAIYCVEKLRSEEPSSSNAFLVAALLKACFNIAAILDAIRVAMWCGATKVHVQGVSQSDPLHPADPDAACDGSHESSCAEDAGPLEDDEMAHGESSRQSRSRGGIDKQRSKRSRKSKARSISDDFDEDDDGANSFGCHQNDEVDFGSSSPNCSDPFDKFDGPRAYAGGFGRSSRSSRRAHATAEHDEAESRRKARIKKEVEDVRREAERQRQKQQPNHPQAPQTSTASEPTPAQIIDHAAMLADGTLSKAGHYAMLGVSKQAQDSEIKKAFHQMSRKWHPDKNPEDTAKAEAIFRMIKEAYDCLSDPTKRKRYDKFFAP